MNSIRRRLLVALLGALLVAGIAGAGATFLSARGEVGRLLDEELRQVALSLRDHSRLDFARLESRTNDPDLRVLVQIWDPAFDRPYSSRVATPLPRQKDEGYTTLEHEGRAWRIYTTFSATQTIQVAQPTALRTELAALTAARLLLPVLAILPLLGILGWWIVGRGLAPLAALADSLARRAPTSLDPVPVLESPEEVQPLVRSLNDLLARLGDAFDTQRRFAADAAHELRTPLTALTLQIQIARRAESPEERAVALDRLEQGVKRATRLVQQLLTMARLDPDAARPATSFDLASVAASVVEEKKPLAEQQRLALSLAAVAGDAVRAGRRVADPARESRRQRAALHAARRIGRRARRPGRRPGAHRRRGQRSRHSRRKNANGCSTGSIEVGRRRAAAAAWDWPSCGRSSRCTAGRSHWARARPAGFL